MSGRVLALDYLFFDPSSFPCWFVDGRHSSSTLHNPELNKVKQKKVNDKKGQVIKKPLPIGKGNSEHLPPSIKYKTSCCLLPGICSPFFSPLL
jgi:hypothetical protein